MEVFYDRVQLVKGPSFGTDFTIVCPYFYLAHYDLVMDTSPNNLCDRLGMDRNLIRISVGCEPIEELLGAFASGIGCPLSLGMPKAKKLYCEASAKAASLSSCRWIPTRKKIASTEWSILNKDFLSDLSRILLFDTGLSVASRKGSDTPANSLARSSANGLVSVL